jgi:uncharacterized protein YuzE
MKRLFFVLLVCALSGVQVFSYSDDSDPLNLKGFYLGMEKNEVNQLYQKFKSDQVAQYISIEPSDYRDLIQLDNEFSSMGNKIELNYDESGKVVYIKFQYKTVAILFGSGALSAEEFVQKFSADYNIPEMVFEDMGMVKTWSCSDETRKFSLSIDDYQNITLKVL